MSELVLCGDKGPERIRDHGFSACPLDQGHEGAHFYYSQTKPDAKRGVNNGVWVVDEEGKTAMHMTYDGGAKPEEVGALLALLEYAKQVKKP